ncbi:MAG: hypothetical protein ACP5TI_00560 [Thermoprotei archaeon]
MKTKPSLLIFMGITFSQLFAVAMAYLSKPISIISINPNGSLTVYTNSTVKQVSPSNLTSHLPVQAISPFGVGVLGSFLVSIALVLGSLVAAFLMVIALRKGYMTYVVAGVLGAATFLLNYYIDSFLFGYVSPLSVGIPVFLSGLIVIYSLMPSKFRGLLYLLANVVVLLNGAELGFFLAVSFQKMTVIFLAFVFSAYDFYSVFRGPISRMLGRPTSAPEPGLEEAVQKPEKKLLGPMMVNFGQVEMGLGDITFYSMMPTAIYMAGMGLIPVFLEVLLIDFGVALTLILLKKIRPLPGLPIPLLLGVVAFFLRPSRSRVRYCQLLIYKELLLRSSIQQPLILLNQFF